MAFYLQEAVQALQEVFIPSKYQLDMNTLQSRILHNESSISSYAVTLSAAGNHPIFRGFIIQGRLAADDSPGVGTFVTPPPGSVARLSSCNIPSVRKEIRPKPAAQARCMAPLATHAVAMLDEINLIMSLQSAITHNTGSDKDSVTVSWTAPYAGTGAVTFAYVCVQS